MAVYDLTPVVVPKVKTAFRRIATPLPVPESLPLFRDLERSEPRSMRGQLPVVWDRAEGFTVSDRWGNRWIDWSSGVLIANAGHGRREIRDALKAALDHGLLASYVFVHEKRAELTRRLQALAPALDADAVSRALDDGVRAYVERHGDKTRRIDPATGRPKVARHVDVEPCDAHTVRVQVHGSTGHMGSILENDDAILKWAYLVRALEAAQGRGLPAFELELEGQAEPGLLVLEGGQGFLPTHPIGQVQDRLAAAFRRGLAGYLAAAGAPPAGGTSRATPGSSPGPTRACPC